MTYIGRCSDSLHHVPAVLQLSFLAAYHHRCAPNTVTLHITRSWKINIGNRMVAHWSCNTDPFPTRHEKGAKNLGALQRCPAGRAARLGGIGLAAE